MSFCFVLFSLVFVYLMCGPRQLFFQYGPEMPKSWIPLNQNFYTGLQSLVLSDPLHFHNSTVPANISFIYYFPIKKGHLLLFKHVKSIDGPEPLLCQECLFLLYLSHHALPSPLRPLLRCHFINEASLATLLKMSSLSLCLLHTLFTLIFSPLYLIPSDSVLFLDYCVFFISYPEGLLHEKRAF